MPGSLRHSIHDAQLVFEAPAGAAIVVAAMEENSDKAVPILSAVYEGSAIAIADNCVRLQVAAGRSLLRLRLVPGPPGSWARIAEIMGGAGARLVLKRVPNGDDATTVELAIQAI
jgi:hypothetical protein